MILDLNGKLRTLKEGDFLKEFDQITPECTELHLGSNNLFNRPISLLKNAFTKIPVTVTVLDISANELYNLTTDQIIELVENLPQVRELRLSQNGLGYRSGLDLARILEKLPPSIRALSLKDNELKNVSYFPEVMRALTEKLEELYLDNNGLGMINGGLEEGFKAIKAKLNVLSLSNNHLENRSIPSLTHLVANLKAKFICLAQNHLGQKPGARLGEVIAKIDSQVEYVDLSDNGLGVKSNKDLSEIFSNAKGQYQINLEKNNLNSEQENIIDTAVASEEPNASISRLSTSAPALSSLSAFIQSQMSNSTNENGQKSPLPTVEKPTQNIEDTNYYFYLKCFAALSVTGGASFVLLGVLVLHSTTISLTGAGFIFLSALSLPNHHGFFTKSNTTPPQNNEQPQTAPVPG